MAAEVEFFTLTSLFSLLGVVGILLLAQQSATSFLPSGSSKKDRYTYVWLVFDALIHFSFEGSFLFLSFPRPRTVFSATPGMFKELWVEYAKADRRWGTSDPTVVSLELLTVLGAGPLCLYIAWMMMKGDRARHYWIVVLSTAEIYGGWMTFAPEWITGCENLNTSNWLHLWVYLFFMNTIWVVVPLVLMYDSFGYIALALRSPEEYSQLLKEEDALLSIKAKKGKKA